ncbi:hypothetical protein CYMTET_47731 [Cymbomonas tetramitiformis]|uniref:SF3 helicase domain-containing protein n=1 Tax=Cymbomonas tetramitiformis TaxID=36881 RepID=A0AAE0EWE7_9CHLO|nr:hypothetical protein CYMTET_47731 [Cymbomonas tetramitiformis]
MSLSKIKGFDGHVKTRLAAQVASDFADVVKAVHRENDHAPETRLEDVTTALVRAIVEPTQHLDIGIYLFYITNRIYRYGFDEAQGAYSMYRYNGARWISSGAHENFECESQEFIVEILQQVYVKWNEYASGEGMLKWIRETCRLRGVQPKNVSRDERKGVRRFIRDAVAEFDKVKTLYHNIAKEGGFGVRECILVRLLVTVAVSQFVREACRIDCEQVVAGVSQALRSCEKRLKSSISCENNGILSPVNFFNALDEQDFLIGFENGVYNLNESKFYETHSVPRSYMVSMSVGFDFVRINDEMRDYMQEIKSFVYERIFPEECTRRQIEAVVGSLLSIGNPMKKLVLLLGDGDNGKSAFVSRLLKSTLGDYFGTIPVQVLTERKEGADGCNPSLSANRKRRCLVLNEGDKRMRLNSGMTKTLTGNDEIQFRNLYKQPISARFHATLIYLSNVAPELESGQALRNRSYPVDCISTFDANVTRDDPQKKIYRRLSDTDFAYRCTRWRMAHMHMAIEWWTRLRLRNFVLPPVPLASTANRMLDERSEDGVFKRWLLDNYESIRNPPSDVKNALQIKDIRLKYNAQVSDPTRRFVSDAECKRCVRAVSDLRVKDQQRVCKSNIRNFVYARHLGEPSDSPFEEERVCLPGNRERSELVGASEGLERERSPEVDEKVQGTPILEKHAATDDLIESSECGSTRERRKGEDHVASVTSAREEA